MRDMYHITYDSLTTKGEQIGVFGWNYGCLFYVLRTLFLLLTINIT